MIKKQLIMEKALELFANQGFEATSVQQITEHCGISKGAFYLSFKSKDELILSLIDYFMSQFISDIDYIVKNTKDDTELLFKFYYSGFQSFLKHSDFGKVLIKEQAHTFNEELLLKFHNYDRLVEKTILTMVERLFNDTVTDTKYDLAYCIKGFMSMYSHLFLFYNVPLDLNLLSQSLVEKTNLIAKHTTVPFLTKDLVQMFKKPSEEEKITKEQLLDILAQKIAEIEECIEKESLIIIKQQIIDPTLSSVIIRGLLENIRNHPHCKWVDYLLRQYYGF
jgi:AcrR family transcriptional regulator